MDVNKAAGPLGLFLADVCKMGQAGGKGDEVNNTDGRAEAGKNWSLFIIAEHNSSEH